MKGALTQNQIEYVLFHLGQHLGGLDRLRPYFRFVTSVIPDYDLDKIVFYMSEEELVISQCIEVRGVPILFPLTGSPDIYEMIDNDTLIFNHDLLKSAFYLLSGYQEQMSDETDFMARFPYEKSVQKKLGVITKPLVNYYFDLLIEGFELFAERNGIDIYRKQLFDSFGFLLSHDIDRIDYYHWKETAYRWMQVFGLKKAHYPKKRLFKAAINSILPTIFPGLKEDPYWSFKKMRETERKCNIISSWYFLNRDGSPHDARYYFSEKRIKDVMNFLNKEECEVGLHGSIKTASNRDAMRGAFSALSDSYTNEIAGTRQHFLKFFYPETFKIQSEVGLKYDTTLGFAGHEGFRNGYCYPFKLYDLKNNKMIDMWEFPLNVMDGTLFYYRNLSFEDAEKAVLKVVSEVQKFGGIFSLLWHNSMFDEYEMPGITAFYNSLLKTVTDKATKSMSGKQLLQVLKDYETP